MSTKLKCEFCGKKGASRCCDIHPRVICMHCYLIATEMILQRLDLERTILPARILNVALERDRVIAHHD